MWFEVFWVGHMHAVVYFSIYLLLTSGKEMPEMNAPSCGVFFFLYYIINSVSIIYSISFANMDKELKEDGKDNICTIEEHPKLQPKSTNREQVVWLLGDPGIALSIPRIIKN